MQIIRSTSPEKLNLLHAIKTPSARIATKLEKLLQKRFAHKKSFDYSDEWLDLNESEKSFWRPNERHRSKTLGVLSHTSA
jgi:hypothetical protein